MAIVGRPKYIRARAKFRGDATRRERPLTLRLLEISRARVYLAHPKMTIAKIVKQSSTSITLLAIVLPAVIGIHEALKCLPVLKQVENWAYFSWQANGAHLKGACLP